MPPGRCVPQQVMVYQRLGYYKLMTLTPRPYGIHFRLQLKTQEGRETAMRLCYLATSIYKVRPRPPTAHRPSRHWDAAIAAQPAKQGTRSTSPHQCGSQGRLTA